MIFNYFWAKVLQGSTLLIISIYGNYILEPSLYVLMMSIASLMAFAHTIDAGLSVSILHLSAKFTHSRKENELLEIYSIAHHSYKALAIIYFISFTTLGSLYLTQIYNIGIEELLTFLFNCFFTAMYISNVGKAAFYEGVDASKKIIKLRAVSSFGALCLIIFIFSLESTFVLMTPIMFFLCFVSALRYFSTTFTRLGYPNPLGFRTTMNLLFSKYLNNQLRIVVAWIAGYLLLHVPVLTAAILFEPGEIHKYILAMVLLQNALSFSNIFIQPYINSLATALHDRNLFQLRRLCTVALLKIVGCCILLLFSLWISFILTIINAEMYELIFYCIMAWLFMTLIFVLSFILRSQQGEQLQIVSLSFAILYNLFIVTKIPQNSKELVYGFATICFLYLLTALVVFRRKFYDGLTLYPESRTK